MSPPMAKKLKYSLNTTHLDQSASVAVAVTVILNIGASIWLFYYAF